MTASSSQKRFGESPRHGWISKADPRRKNPGAMSPTRPTSRSGTCYTPRYRLQRKRRRDRTVGGAAGSTLDPLSRKTKSPDASSMLGSEACSRRPLVSQAQAVQGALLPGALVPEVDNLLPDGLPDTGQSPALQPAVCPTGGDHAMVWTAEASYDVYICNRCRAVATGERWHCELHHDDYCEKCWPRNDDLGSSTSVHSSRPVSPMPTPAWPSVDPAPTQPGHFAFSQSERLRRLLDPHSRGCRLRSKMPPRAESAAPAVRSERKDPQDWSRPWRTACSSFCRTSPRKEVSYLQSSSTEEHPERLFATAQRASQTWAAPVLDSAEEFVALERELAQMDCVPEQREATPQPDGSTRLTGVSCITHISLEDMRMVRSAFDRYDGDRDGQLTHEEFQCAITHLLGGSVAEDESIRKAQDAAWRDADRSGDGTVDLREFFQWYCLNGFNEDLLLNDDQKYLRRIAKEYQVNVNTVDNIKYYFDMYDSDRSGVIEFDEFQHIVHKLMRVPANQVLPLSRMQYFWSELDADQSGTVEFEEFLCWWLNNFDDSCGEAKRAPFEKFYGQIRKLGKRLRERTSASATHEGKRASLISGALVR